MRKFIIAVLLITVAMLQYRLWFGKNSIADYRAMQAQVDTLAEQNANLKQRNVKSRY